MKAASSSARSRKRRSSCQRNGGPAYQQQIQICELSKPLVGEWENILAMPVETLPTLLPARCELLARERRSADIVQAVEKLQELAESAADPDEKAEMLFNAACGYSQCAKLAVGWNGFAGAWPPNPAPELTEELKAAKTKYAVEAIACLKEAIAAGWTDFVHMRQDPDLAVLQGLPEFEALFPNESGPRGRDPF